MAMAFRSACLNLSLLPLREKVGFREAKGRMRGAQRLNCQPRRALKLSAPPTLSPSPSPSRGEGGSRAMRLVFRLADGKA